MKLIHVKLNINIYLYHHTASSITIYDKVLKLTTYVVYKIKQEAQWATSLT